MSAAESVVTQIQHYQKSIQKYHGNSSRILHCISRLYALPVTVQHLQDTGVGKTINSLRKSDGEVGESARALVAKWKQMVEEESENEQESNVSVQTHPNDDGTDNHRVKSDRRSRENYSTSREDPQSDHSKSHKRMREFETEQLKEKRHKNEKSGSSSSHNLIDQPHIKEKLNGNGRYPYDEWSIDRHSREMESDDEHDLRDVKPQIDEVSCEEPTEQFSDSDLNNGEFLTPSPGKELWPRKESEKKRKKEKSSSVKHKHKSSSSHSEKSRHSSSRSELKDSKSPSSSKHRDEKSSSGSNSNTFKRDTLSERSEDKAKVIGKERREKQKDKHRSKDVKKSKEKLDKETKVKVDEDGVDSNSGKSFGEALGMMFLPDKQRKKSSLALSSSHSPSKKKSKSSSSIEKKTQVKSELNLSPEAEPEYSPGPFPQSMEVDEDFGLPALDPNYKPLPQPNFFNSPPKRFLNDDDLSNIMYSKVQRTKVFSGNKTGYTYVPSLFDLCTRVLQENIDALEYTGGVPFDLLKPVLERATPDQLFTLEHFNTYLIEDTDVFWEYHCKKDFRNKKREEMETWREMYLRCRDEREVKLRSLTANIAASSKAKALPLRKTQLAYIESSAKPPRNIARKQAKYGTGQAPASTASRQDSHSLSSSFTGRPNSAHASGPAVAVPAPRGAGGSAHSSSCKPKPKAPLMQKALQLIKYNRFKR